MAETSSPEVSEEARALVLLDTLPGVGPRTVQRLVSAFGSARRAVRADPARFRAAAGGRLGPEALTARSARSRHRIVEDGLARARDLGMTVLTWDEAAYPERLRHLTDPPPVLFLRGRVSLLEPAGVAVVGARRATLRGRDVARRLGAGLASRGVPVVSGMALGVDGAAHAGALEAGGPTVAVLGGGADRASPRSHAVLFRRILDEGLVVSEFLPGTRPRPHHFPRRNRVVAALAHTVVVVEAGARSGALITVDHALDLGREVYAVPGPIDTASCAGSNTLLGEGAHPLASLDAFLVAMTGGAGRGEEADASSSEGEAATEGARGAPPAGIAVDPGPDDGSLQLLLRRLDEGDGPVEELARSVGLSPARTLALLTRLELLGQARRLPGARYGRGA